ncbi:MAG: hypothetical protein D6674_02960 [Acidobacteria bacterium]|jgi:hypothetical protein|nr:MAG: hypothetical protein D6674_02960 [Acidobacteriota bacterium]
MKYYFAYGSNMNNNQMKERCPDSKFEDEKNLDRYEGNPKVYQKKFVSVVGESVQIYEALVYYREGQEVGRPHESHRNIVYQGAKECKLSEGYIKRFILGK